MDFEDLPRSEKVFLIRTFGLPRDEEEILTLRYIDGFSYSRIAAEMTVSEKSVGPMLTKARKHMVAIAKSLFGIHDDRTTKLIEVLGWDDLEWPTLRNRHSERG